LRSRRIGHWAFLFAGVALLLVIDQATKFLVRQNLAVNESWAPIPALARFFTITHVQNTGVAFGSMPGLGWLFMLVNLTVLVGIVLYYPRVAANQWLTKVSMVLIAAGALGNVIDRVRTAVLLSATTGSLWQALPRVYVTDFVDVKIWPVWNVADMCVVAGVSILAWILWQAEKKESQAEPAGDEPSETNERVR